MKRLCMFCLLLSLLALPALAQDAEAAPVAQNERLQLFVSADCASVEIRDAVTGAVWSSAMNDETFAGQRVNATLQKKMSSLLMINYTNLNQGLGSINNMALLADKQYGASYTPIENGVRLHYVFGSCQIELDVDVTLDKDSFLVRVPYQGIRENGVYSLVSIDLMPYLCAASDKADGYFLYPDGSGAVMEFSDNAHLNEKSRLYSVYGNLEKHETLLSFFDKRDPEVFLPVFGMSRGGSALVCAVEEGAETARISLNFSSKIVGINYLYANLQYRRGFDDMRVTDRSFKIYDKAPIQTDYALRVLLPGRGETDYSAMARAYREYLLQSGALADQTVENAVLLDIFLTANEKGLLADAPRTVTTLAQAGQMLTELSDMQVSALSVSLKGWSSDGYGNAPDHFPVGGSAGGDGGLAKLLETARGCGYDVSLISDFLRAKATQGGYSKRNDIIYTGNYAILTDKKESVFLLSPDVTVEKFNAFFRRAEAFDLSGVRFACTGQMLPFNYFSMRTVTAAQTLIMYQDMLRSVSERFGSASVQGGALYAAKYASLLTDIPMEDFRYTFTTRSVPFYQLVMHGLRAYAATPGNLSPDPELEMLRWVELGCAPYFELTWEDTEDLMYTEYQSLFSAEFSAWKDTVQKAHETFCAGALAKLSDRQMLSHETLPSGVARVTYEGGYTVYVNKTQTDAAADGVTVPARDYVVIGGDRP